METLYTWIDANLDKIKYLLSANFVVLSIVLVAVRFHDGGMVFMVCSAAATVFSGYAMICGAFWAMQFRNLKVRAAHIDHFGGFEFEANDPLRDGLAVEVANVSEPLNRSERNWEAIVFGLKGKLRPFEEMSFQDFERRIEGVEVRSVLATILSTTLCSMAVLIFVFGKFLE